MIPASQSVVDLMLTRARSGSRPGRRVPEDRAHLALCIEGGSMRGVVSAGMVSALEALGMLDAFDVVYGSSAGAINGAFLVAGQAAYGTTIYYENINNRRFINPRRALVGRPIVDLDFLIWEVMRREKILDAARVVDDRRLRVVATNADTADAETLQYSDADSLLSAMRAGATMPITAGPAFLRGGRRYFDASVTCAIPVDLAERDGATHILALLTRPRGVEKRGVSRIESWWILPRLARYSNRLADRYRAAPIDYRQTVDAIENGRGPDRRAHVLGLQPSAPVVSKQECRRSVLVSGAISGIRAVLEAVAPDQVARAETLLSPA